MTGEGGESDRELEKEFGGDVEAAAEAERGKLETRRQKVEKGKERMEKKKQIPRLSSG
jgi:hypothetical protein